MRPPAVSLTPLECVTCKQCRCYLENPLWLSELNWTLERSRCGIGNEHLLNMFHCLERKTIIPPNFLHVLLIFNSFWVNPALPLPTTCLLRVGSQRRRSMDGKTLYSKTPEWVEQVGSQGELSGCWERPEKTTKKDLSSSEAPKVLLSGPLLSWPLWRWSSLTQGISTVEPKEFIQILFMPMAESYLGQKKLTCWEGQHLLPFKILLICSEAKFQPRGAVLMPSCLNSVQLRKWFACVISCDL